jgi:hypothetical protein
MIHSSARARVVAICSKLWFGWAFTVACRRCLRTVRSTFLPYTFTAISTDVSYTGYPFTPVATVTIGGVTFDLAYGLNGSVKVYSFVARGGLATNFSADLVRLFLLSPTSLAQDDGSLIYTEYLLQVPPHKLREQWIHV